MQVPDWASIIERLEEVGESRRAISNRMQLGLTDKMLRAYKLGAQPAYFRGVGLIQLWHERFNGTPVPMTGLIRGHRAGRPEIENGPRITGLLPCCPVAVPVAVAPGKRKVGRPRKVQEVA